ncbi:hypothetical protein B0919_18175 [Hymenobacter sp. CRA2]|nr:hypothetical protein B0919_18175 [Hymenobacter sp. CRA2]
MAAQDQQTTFRKAYQINDTATMRLTLARWRQQEPRNANVYVARASYLLRRAEQSRGRKGSPAAPAGKAAAPTAAQLTEAAQDALCQALTLAPDRLDVHFALAKSYEKQGDARQQVVALRQALNSHGKNGQPWYWYDSAELPAPEGEFVPASLDDYAEFYWQQGGEAALATGKQLTELITEFYPESYLGPFNLSQYYSSRGQHEEALAQLKQAAKLQPKEAATLAALVKTSLVLGHKTEAQQYLTQLRKLPETQELVAELNQQLKQVK